MADQETKQKIKSIKTRSFIEGEGSLNPTLYPSQQIDKAFYEDLKANADGFGLGSVLVEKLSVYEEGATLLDYFAGIALKASLDKFDITEASPENAQILADDSYKFAEEMLKAREKALKRIEATPGHPDQ